MPEAHFLLAYLHMCVLHCVHMYMKLCRVPLQACWSADVCCPHKHLTHTEYVA